MPVSRSSSSSSKPALAGLPTARLPSTYPHYFRKTQEEIAVSVRGVIGRRFSSYFSMSTDQHAVVRYRSRFPKASIASGLCLRSQSRQKSRAPGSTVLPVSCSALGCEAKRSHCGSLPNKGQLQFRDLPTFPQLSARTHKDLSHPLPNRLNYLGRLFRAEQPSFFETRECLINSSRIQKCCALVEPGLDEARIQLDSSVEACDGFSQPSHTPEGLPTIIPSFQIGWVEG